MGAGVFPVDVRVTFDDDSSITQQWDGASPRRSFSFRRGARVRLAEVDPDDLLRLDVHRTNNTWTSEPQARAAATKWSLRWFTWLEHQLLTYAFFV